MKKQISRTQKSLKTRCGDDEREDSPRQYDSETYETETPSSDLSWAFDDRAPAEEALYVII